MAGSFRCHSHRKYPFLLLNFVPFESRRSIRQYTSDPLTLQELAYLLWCTEGIVQRHEPYATFRNVPSAGGRHAFETYLQINRVSGLEPGLYRYLAFTHCLMPIEIRPDTADRIMEACLRQAIMKNSAVTFIWSCVIYRMAWRYSERAYRLVHLDAGHVCQNLYPTSRTSSFSGSIFRILRQTT